MASKNKINANLDAIAKENHKDFSHLKNDDFYAEFNDWFDEEIGHLQAKGKISLGETDDDYIADILHAILLDRGEID